MTIADIADRIEALIVRVAALFAPAPVEPDLTPITDKLTALEAAVAAKEPAAPAADPAAV